MKFTKPPLRPEEHIVLLKARDLLNNINPTCSFKKRLKALLDEYNDIPKRYMGFPDNFEDEPIWA